MSDSESDDEASPNVELLVQQAFAEADPAPSLLKVAKEHPNYESNDQDRNLIIILIECYLEAVEKNPTRGQVLASALVKLDTLLAAGEISSGLEWRSPFAIDFEKEAKDYGPKNTFLLHSLLSGLSLKYRLFHNSDMYAAIEKGLDPSYGMNRWHPYNSVDPQVLVLGACIQLLLDGSAITTKRAGPHYGRSAEVVAKSLKDQKAAGIVKDPHAIQVLEVSKLFHD